MKCSRCGTSMQREASAFGSYDPVFGCVIETVLCENCTDIHLKHVMTLRCSRPTDGDFCCLPMGHDGEHVPREAADR